MGPKNPANSPVDMVNIPIIYEVLAPSNRWSQMGFLNQQQYLKNIWHARSRGNGVFSPFFLITPLKINMEHNNGGLEDDFPF